MDNARITVRLTPRAAHDAIVGFEGEAHEILRVRVTAPPVEGRANLALVRLLTARLGVAQSAVRVVAGQSGRTKILAIDGLTFEAVRARLEQDG